MHPIDRVVEIWLERSGRSRPTGGTGDVRVLFYGAPVDDFWRRALEAASPVWRRLPEVSRVAFVPRRFGDGLVRAAGADTVVIPLTEADLRVCPPGGRRSAPSPEVVERFRDKRRFAAWVEDRGLGDVAALPLRFDAPSSFPCVLKRTDQRNGRGVVRVDGPDELAARLREPAWKGRPVVLQEWIDGAEEYVTHLVCDGGRIRWHRTYAYGLRAGETIRSDARIETKRPVEVSPADLADMARLLEPVGYTGPCNLNFKRRANGRIAVFEINPRFGGSLMRPEGLPDLAEALVHLVAQARG